MTVKRKLLYGKNSRYTFFGLRGCSHGMYSRNNYNFYVYGIKGILGVEIIQEW